MPLTMKLIYVFLVVALFPHALATQCKHTITKALCKTTSKTPCLDKLQKNKISTRCNNFRVQKTGLSNSFYESLCTAITINITHNTQLTTHATLKSDIACIDLANQIFQQRKGLFNNIGTRYFDQGVWYSAECAESYIDNLRLNSDYPSRITNVILPEICYDIIVQTHSSLIKFLSSNSYINLSCNNIPCFINRTCDPDKCFLRYQNGGSYELCKNASSLSGECPYVKEAYLTCLSYTKPVVYQDCPLVTELQFSKMCFDVYKDPDSLSNLIDVYNKRGYKVGDSFINTKCIDENTIIYFYFSVKVVNGIIATWPGGYDYQYNFCHDSTAAECDYAKKYTNIYNKLTALYNKNSKLLSSVGFADQMTNYTNFVQSYNCANNATTSFYCNPKCYKDLSTTQNIINELTATIGYYTLSSGIYVYNGPCTKAKTYYQTMIYSANYYLFIQYISGLFDLCDKQNQDCQNEAYNRCSSSDCIDAFLNQCDKQNNDCLSLPCAVSQGFGKLNTTMTLIKNNNMQYTDNNNIFAMYNISDSAIMDYANLNTPYVCFGINTLLPP